jgi:hypothetical protein
METLPAGKQSLDLVDDILDEIENEPTPDPKEPVKASSRPAAVYRRRAKNDLSSQNTEAGNDSPLPSTENIKAETPAVEKEEPVSKEELRERLKGKLRGNRQQKIQDRKKKSQKPSFPLTPIFFCDAPGCTTIMSSEESKMCPVCKCFYYCSKQCQTADWTKHKLMCGKDPDEHHQNRLKLYREARDATQAIYEKVKDGDYMTVIHETGENTVASIFTTVAEKSNLLHWRQYITNPIFTTAETANLAQLSSKLESAIRCYSDSKVFIISCILDRMRDGETTECCIRLFVADKYGECMSAPINGKITKVVPKYVRRGK